jgi:muramidase (phage lysozyme)
MTDREELRRLMELEGHDPETIDKVLAWYYREWIGPDQLAAILNLLTLEMAEAVQRMADLWAQLTAAGVGQPLQKKQKPRRPPRCIGPKNKAATRAQRPARVARSSCRKIHK